MWGGLLPHTALTEEPEPILEFFGVNQRGRVGLQAGRGSQGDSGCPSGRRRNTEEGDPTSCRLIKGREVELSRSVHRSGEGHPTEETAGLGAQGCFISALDFFLDTAGTSNPVEETAEDQIFKRI